MSIKNFFLSIFRFFFHVIGLMIVGALSTFIALRFFTTGDEVVVPNLKGKAPVEAIKLLTDKGLQLKILPQKRFDKEIPADRIISQEPVADTHIKTGRSVEVYMSLGPEKIVVPDLTGQTTRVATLMNCLYSSRTWLSSSASSLATNSRRSRSYPNWFN